MMIHEMGHVIARLLDYQDHPAWSYGYPTPAHCDRRGSHFFGSLEYQHRAADEGFAHFYAASVWNNPADDSCSFFYYKGTRPDYEVEADYDFLPKDGMDDASIVYNCESPLQIGSHWRNSYALYACHCWDPATNDILPVCDAGSFPTGVGNEFDWLRFWWDLHTDGGLSFDVIAEIYDDANPRLWTDGNVDQVYNKITQSAIAGGFHTWRWDFYAELNGVNH